MPHRQLTILFFCNSTNSHNATAINLRSKFHARQSSEQAGRAHCNTLASNCATGSAQFLEQHLPVLISELAPLDVRQTSDAVFLVGAIPYGPRYLQYAHHPPIPGKHKPGSQVTYTTCSQEVSVWAWGQGLQTGNRASLIMSRIQGCH